MKLDLVEGNACGKNFPVGDFIRFWEFVGWGVLRHENGGNSLYTPSDYKGTARKLAFLTVQVPWSRAHRTLL